MADPRFFVNQGPFTLAKLVALTGATLSEGADDTRRFKDVAPLDRANGDDISFLDNTKYIDVFSASKAGACFVRHKFSVKAPPGMALLIADEPYKAYALAAQLFYPAAKFASDVSPHAHIDATASIGENTVIDHGAVIGKGVKIGKNCVIGANAVIRDMVEVGDYSMIGACSTLSHCLIGERVIIHRGVHIGQDGFGFALGREGHIKVPQLGRVIIENDVEIGSGTCIDRGTGPDTIIGEGTKIDNLVQVGHNVHIGRNCILVGQSGVAGSTRLGDSVMLGGQVGIAGHIKIGSGARLAAQSGVMSDVPAGAFYGGTPAVPAKDWHRQTIALSRLIKRGDNND